MPEAFDPYRKWLGIPPAEQPPHHYRLLGIGLFEDDPDVIESAADQRMSHLRTFQAGAHSALSQKLLNEVAAAKLCLLSADKKAAYDAELRRRQGAAKPQRPLPTAKVLTESDRVHGASTEMPVVIADAGAESRARLQKRRATRRMSPALLVAGAATLLVLIVVGLLALGRSTPPSAKPTSTTAGAVAARLEKKPDGQTSAAATAQRPVTDIEAPHQPAPAVVAEDSKPKSAPDSAVAADGSSNPTTKEPMPVADSQSETTSAATDDSAETKAENTGPPRAIAPFNEKQAHAHQNAWAEHLNVPIEQTNSLGMRLVLIPPGEFTMGSTPEQIEEAKQLVEQSEDKFNEWTIGRLQAELPAHRVTITRPYLAGTTEVTVRQFRRFVEATSYVTEAEQFGGGSSTSKDEHDPQKKQRKWSSPDYLVGDDSAVSEITWSDAAAFCNWLSEKEQKAPCYRRDGDGNWLLVPEGDGYRLPTEAEWEYACRAGTTTQFSFADDLASFDRYSWSLKIGTVPEPHAVAMKKPNGFGLYDMHGNAEEWCHDSFGPTYYASSPAADPTGPPISDQRVMRGGSRSGGILCCRSAFRRSYPPFWRFGDLGFRVVRVSTVLPDQARPLAKADAKPAEMAKSEANPSKPRSLADLKDEKTSSSDKNGKQLTAEEAFTLTKHVGAVTRVTYHPTLPLLASAGKDGRVFLWNLDTKSPEGELARFTVEVWALKFSPNGELLAYGSRDWWKSVVTFKTVESAREVTSLGNFKYGGGAVASIAYSPDGALFAAGQDDGTIRLWNTASLQEVSPLSVGSNVLSLVFGPVAVDRKRKRTEYLLAAGCQDGTLQTLQVTVAKTKDELRHTFERTGTAFPQLGSVLSVRFSPDGKLLGCTRSGGLIALHDPSTGESVRQLQATNGEANWLSFHPQRPWCVTAHKNDRLARVWDTETGQGLCELRGHTGGVLCAEFSRDGRRIATASEDFSIKVWDLAGPDIATAAKRPKKGKAAAPLVGD